MRPIAVLLLVLGAISALLFAFLSISSDAGRAGGAVTAAAESSRAAAPPPASPLARVDQVADPAQPLQVRVPETPQEREEIPAGGNPAIRNELRVTVLGGVDKRPVAEAEVRLLIYDQMTQLGEMALLLQGRGAGKAIKTLKTAEDGTCTFQGLDPTQEWGLVVDHPSFQRSDWGPVTMPEKGLVEEFVPLTQGRVLMGTVVDRDTRMPIQAARLVLDDPISALLGNPKRRGSLHQETETDEVGRFQFQQVPPSGLVLIVEADGHASQMRNDIAFLEPQQMTLNVEVVMEPGLMIAGRVVGPDMEGIKGAEIEAISHQGRISSRGRTRSGEGGEFVITDLAEGLYTLRTEVVGFDVDPSMRVEAGDTNVEIRCYEQGGVIGRVIDAQTGRSLSDFTIKARTNHPTHPGFGQVVAQQAFRDRKSGAFELGGISEGTFVLQADADGYASTFSDPFPVKQGMTTPDIVVRISKGGTLIGRVLDAYTGNPIPGVQVQTRDNNWVDSDFTNILGNLSPSAITKLSAQTDGDGTFTFRLLTPGDYQVSIKHKDYTTEVINDIRVSNDLETELPPVHLSRGAVVRGTVYTADGAVARGYEVVLRPVDNALFNRGMQGRTDANGRYVLSNVAAGDYMISASRPQSAASGSPFDVVIDMKNSEVDIQVADAQEYTQDLYLGK